MCCFAGQPATVTVRTPDDPAYGYKLLQWTGSGLMPGVLTSVHQRVPWGDEAQLSARNNRGRRVRPSKTGDGPGIYAWAERKEAVKSLTGYGAFSRQVLVEVSLWGKVVEYGSATTWGAMRPPGYMAEHAEVHVVWVSSQLPASRRNDIRRRLAPWDISVRTIQMPENRGVR